MAEATSTVDLDDLIQNNRFYCHQCKDEITPNIPDFTCPSCSGGFIEQIEDEPPFFPPSSTRTSGPSSQLEEDNDDGLAALGPAFMLGHHPLFGPMTHTRHVQGGGRGGPRTHISVRRVNPSRAQVQIEGGNLQTVLEQLLVGLTGRGGAIMLGGPSGLTFGGLAGNPGDYVWGEGGLDAIITQLMNQLEGTGPPPASTEKIEGLPNIIVNSDHVARTVQCNVCFDDLSLGESVKQLPCQHLYHKDCIVPWLVEHGTCPVCRKTLDGTDTTCDQNAQSIPETLQTIGLNPQQTGGAHNSTETTNTSNSTTASSADNRSSPSNSSSNEEEGRDRQMRTDYDDYELE